MPSVDSHDWPCYLLPTMAKRLSVKHRKQTRDKARAYKEGTAPRGHKVAVERSTKAKRKLMYRP
jgi:hypothetical protein